MMIEDDFQLRIKANKIAKEKIHLETLLDIIEKSINSKARTTAESFIDTETDFIYFSERNLGNKNLHIYGIATIAGEILQYEIHEHHRNEALKQLRKQRKQ